MRRSTVVYFGRVCAIFFLALVSACGGEFVANGAAAAPETFTLSNHLIAPVTILLDGAPYLWLPGGGSTSFSVASTAQRLTWISAKPLDPRGTPIPDDIGTVTISLGASAGQLSITNIIDNQPYITARIYNETNQPVSIGVFNGSELSCVSELPAGSAAAPGLTLIGYYKLLVGTEIRAYHEARGCTGPYLAWPASQVRAYTVQSGQVVLALQTAP